MFMYSLWPLDQSKGKQALPANTSLAQVLASSAFAVGALVRQHQLFESVGLAIIGIHTPLHCEHAKGKIAQLWHVARHNFMYSRQEIRTFSKMSRINHRRNITLDHDLLPRLLAQNQHAGGC